MNLALITVFLGMMQVTSYRSVPSQTDNSPFFTSIGEHVNPHGIAVSQDLLAKNGGPINYGDTVYVQGIGFKVVNDTMNARFRNRADVWVSSYEEEKRFERKFKGKKLLIWIIHPVLKGTNDKTTQN